MKMKRREKGGVWEEEEREAGKPLEFLVDYAKSKSGKGGFLRREDQPIIRLKLIYEWM